MKFDKYLIPDPANEGVLSGLYAIPSNEIIRKSQKDAISEIFALESYIESIMSTLVSPIAMEGTIESDNVTRIAEKARMGGKKVREGKDNNNPSMITQGLNEVSSSIQDLKSETNKTKDPKRKAKLWMVAKVVGAVIATILLTIGAVKAGKAISEGIKSTSSDSIKTKLKEAKTSLREAVKSPDQKQAEKMEAEAIARADAVARGERLVTDFEHIYAENIETGEIEEVSLDDLMKSKGRRLIF